MKLLTRSTRFTRFFTALNSKIQRNVVTKSRIFAVLFSKSHWFLIILCNCCPKLTNVDDFFPDVQNLVYGKDQNTLDSQISEFPKLNYFETKIVEFSENEFRKVRKTKVRRNKFFCFFEQLEILKKIRSRLELEQT